MTVFKTVSATSLNLRATAAKNGKIVVRLPHGQRVEILDDGKYGWSKIRTVLSGTTYEGFVANEYLGEYTAPTPIVVKEPVWLVQARKYIGVKEFPGSANNPVIVSWWSKIGAPFRDDATPWCAAFTGGVLEEVGIRSSRSAAARSYEKWGTPLSKPVVGCIVTFWRGSPNSGSGHVGFVVGKDQNGNLLVLGGNQGDEVDIAAFGFSQVTGYHYPTGYPLPTDLPVYNSSGQVISDSALS